MHKNQKGITTSHQLFAQPDDNNAVYPVKNGAGSFDLNNSLDAGRGQTTVFISSVNKL